MPNPDETPAGRAPYLRIADELRHQITSGQLAVGAPLPSYTQVGRAHGVAMSTAQKAIGILRGEGLVGSANGIGTYVIANRPHPYDHGDTIRALKELHRRLDTLEAAVHDLQELKGRSRRGSAERHRPTRA